MADITMLPEEMVPPILEEAEEGEGKSMVEHLP